MHKHDQGEGEVIDIRQIVAEIVKAKGASDMAAFQSHTHAQVQRYGQELLLNLANALAPTSPEEQAVVAWLQQKLVEQAKQIPGPLAPKETA